jgi:hypothetical protein
MDPTHNGEINDTSSGEQTRRTFCAKAATLAVFGGAFGTILQGCSSSTFDVNGRVVGGPAPAPLHQYPTQFTGGILTITA